MWFVSFIFLNITQDKVWYFGPFFHADVLSCDILRLSLLQLPLQILYWIEVWHWLGRSRTLKFSLRSHSFIDQGFFLGSLSQFYSASSRWSLANSSRGPILREIVSDLKFRKFSNNCLNRSSLLTSLLPYFRLYRLYFSVHSCLWCSWTALW